MEETLDSDEPIALGGNIILTSYLSKHIGRAAGVKMMEVIIAKRNEAIKDFVKKGVIEPNMQMVCFPFYSVEHVKTEEDEDAIAIYAHLTPLLAIQFSVVKTQEGA